MKQEGFIALMSVIIISVVLLITVTTLSFGGYAGRFDIENTELKSMSRSLAEACANMAVLKLVNNPNYGGNETVIVDGVPCQIFAVSGFGSTLEVQVAYQSFYTNFKITLQQNPFMVTSWNEVATLP